ncbi:high-potential iron-sulfur protein [Halopiger djelfimassiliensis]|uniref:high-potential iron-sulfur protein n=1 Tax=Halopiger djelfimassiliensis TaxID=1293047 RepID=UPI00067814B6|nr:high-potential iron-sulfur protein [Halopiger djelfimassiliensis]
MGDEPRESRRRLLRVTGCGSLVALAGCLGSDDDENGVNDRPADWCFEDLDESVPDIEANAPSIDGVERKAPENLLSKEDAGYHCGPVEGQQCGNCTFYIDDRDGDAIGACTEVAGQIRSVDWCELWAARAKVQDG